MSDLTPGLVEIVRDFLEADRLMRSLFARFRTGDLRFAELGELVSDDEGSVLFRLKERCHALFRSGGPAAHAVHHREALFDLLVGSLFHEAMKFRESFYQREIYGPRVRALQDEAGAEARGLFQEFERMLAMGTERLEEGLHECEALLSQTRDQLRVLLRLHRENGVLARYLVEQPQRVEAVFGKALDEVLAEIHGEAARSYALAGLSYLTSGYYDDAERAFRDAMTRGGDGYEPLCAYARGMRAYLEGDYGGCIEHIGHWLESDAPGEPTLRQLAHAAVSRIGQLAMGGERQHVGAAEALAQALAPSAERERK